MQIPTSMAHVYWHTDTLATDLVNNTNLKKTAIGFHNRGQFSIKS